jgi:hypothetical protein
MSLIKTFVALCVVFFVLALHLGVDRRKARSAKGKAHVAALRQKNHGNRYKKTSGGKRVLSHRGGAKEPATSKSPNKGRKFVGKTPLGTGNSSESVTEARVLGKTQTYPVYDNPAPLKGKPLNFAIGTKDGKPKSLFWDRGSEGEIVIGPKKDEEFDNTADLITGFHDGAGFTLADKGSFSDRRPLSEGEKRRIAQELPDAVFVRANGKGYRSRGGKLGEMKDLTKDDARKVKDHLEKAVNMPSNWNGDLEKGIVIRKVDGTPMDVKIKANGIKHHKSSIGLAENVIGGKIGPHTLTHEMFHSLSPDKEGGGFIGNKGYEEGVVEMNARHHTPEVARTLFPDASDAEIEAYGNVGHAYDEYTEPLEEMRKALNIAKPRQFYRDLLALPVQDRSDYMRELGRNNPEFEKKFPAWDKALKPGFGDNYNGP